jgi:hypothetical protein
VTVYEALLPDRTDRITRQARRWTFGKTMLAMARGLLAVFAWLLLGLGKLAYWVVATVWLSITWTVAAVKLGWDDARGDRDEAAD